MRKDTIRQLRADRFEAGERFILSRKNLANKCPEVFEYLSAEKANEIAAREYLSAWGELTQAQRETLIPEFLPSAPRALPKDAPPSGRRDMSRAEFHAALARRGFDLSANTIRVRVDARIGVVLRWNARRNEWRLDRRLTLARAIEDARKLSVDV